MSQAPSPRFHALVPCAGTGSRAQTAMPKQYAMLGTRSVVAHTLSALAEVSRLSQVLVVVAVDDTEFESFVPGFTGRVARCGGDTRAQTVANGLRALASAGARPDDWVLVHDAARCFVRAQWVDALIDTCTTDPVGGLLALPLADTLKEERDGRVTATLDRTGKWQAQTPQMFRLGLLCQALERAGPGVTDEASAVEALGFAPRLVPGALENFKLTYPADFDLAERLLRTRP